MSKLNRRGDTIVEVMITLAILGLAFAISYASANRSLIVARNAEEHSEVDQYLEGQVELLRDGVASANAFLTNPATAGHTFCMNPADDAAVDSSNSACTLGVNKLYAVSITRTGSGNGNTDNSYYIVTISWPGLGDLGQQQEQIFYRVYN